MLCTSDMYTLINYVGFINYLFYGVTVAGQIVLRIKQPNIPRPIKVGIRGGGGGFAFRRPSTLSMTLALLWLLRSASSGP